LSVEKGTDTLIRAVAPLSGDEHVVVAGEGGDREQLESLASELGASVTFPGWVQKPDMPALVGRAHVQVVPSRSEAQGMVALEALAAGTPVIASRVGGLPEAIVEGENYFLVEKDDVEELHEAIGGALSDRERIERMRPAAERTAARYSPDRIAGALEAAYLK
jgi:glycosyltransferase involved in cell wall biosynthesis